MIRKELNEMIEFFIAKESVVHIKLSTGRFYNGVIVEKETEDVIVFNDRYVGWIHIFLSQIDKIEEFMEANQ